MNERYPPRWALCDCPSQMSEWESVTAFAVRHRVSLLLHAGRGLNPFVLLQRSIPEIPELGLWVHLRDKTMPALESDLRTAVLLGVKTIFVGDPLPLAAVTNDSSPAGTMHVPAFLARAVQITGSSVRYGTVCRGSHPADVRLLQQLIAAGCAIVALPPQAWEPSARQG
ncbi:MAG TPA: hypothetical protein PKO06_19140, partial [Candidatus Ozemobacteraceae bacterium]|nr:hypothetical protein [Candidatus Ozemobacteraceae bacterium]